VKFIYLAPTIIIVLSANAFAGAAGNPPEAENKATIEKCIADKKKDNQKVERCIGVIADACLEKSEDPSTYGMVNCSTREYDVWEDRLNRTYKKLMSTLEGKPKIRLRDIERAWIAYRDKKCDFYQREEDGTSIIPVNAYCIMEETGRQSLFLDEILGDNQ
jgi:uncharacterized protein YecT (DUF1311 family)